MEMLTQSLPLENTECWWRWRSPPAAGLAGTSCPALCTLGLLLSSQISPGRPLAQLGEAAQTQAIWRAQRAARTGGPPGRLTGSQLSRAASQALLVSDLASAPRGTAWSESDVLLGPDTTSCESFPPRRRALVLRYPGLPLGLTSGFWPMLSLHPPASKPFRIAFLHSSESDRYWRPPGSFLKSTRL